MRNPQHHKGYHTQWLSSLSSLSLLLGLVLRLATQAWKWALDLLTSNHFSDSGNGPATGLVVLQTWLPKVCPGGVLQFQFDQVEPPSKVGNGFGHDTRPQNKANREKGLSSLGWIMQDGWVSSCLLVSSLSNHQTTGHYKKQTHFSC